MCLLPETVCLVEIKVETMGTLGEMEEITEFLEEMVETTESLVEVQTAILNKT